MATCTQLLPGDGRLDENNRQNFNLFVTNDSNKTMTSARFLLPSFAASPEV